jgi:hypothetical protein
MELFWVQKNEEEAADRFFDTVKKGRGYLRETSSPVPDEPEVFRILNHQEHIYKKVS